MNQMIRDALAVLHVNKPIRLGHVDVDPQQPARRVFNINDLVAEVCRQGLNGLEVGRDGG